VRLQNATQDKCLIVDIAMCLHRKPVDYILSYSTHLSLTGNFGVSYGVKPAHVGFVILCVSLKAVPLEEIQKGIWTQ
jgi:D-serine dehydratase